MHVGSVRICTTDELGEGYGLGAPTNYIFCRSIHAIVGDEELMHKLASAHPGRVANLQALLVSMVDAESTARLIYMFYSKPHFDNSHNSIRDRAGTPGRCHTVAGYRV